MPPSLIEAVNLFVSGHAWNQVKVNETLRNLQENCDANKLEEAVIAGPMLIKVEGNQVIAKETQFILYWEMPAAGIYKPVGGQIRS